MVTVEQAIKILDFEGFDSSMLNRAIKAGIIETVSYKGFYSAYRYALVKDSFIDYLYKIGVPERKIDNISDNIPTVS